MMLVCMVPNPILCFDLNDGQTTFKLEKVNFQGQGSANHDPNMRVIWN